MYAFYKRPYVVSLKRWQMGCPALIISEFFLLHFAEKMKSKPYCSTSISFLQLSLSHCNVFLFGFGSCPPHSGCGLRSKLFSCRPDHPSAAVHTLLWAFPSSHWDSQFNHLSARISTEREIKQWLQQQGGEKAEVEGSTNSAVMEQGPGFAHQELTAALGHRNHTGPVAALVLLSVCCYFIQFKC